MIFIPFLGVCVLVHGHRRYNETNDIAIVKSLVKSEELSKESIANLNPNIMFWRPQKVGSSTLLAILASYAFRYSYIPKRKGSNNLFCKNIAKCALQSTYYYPLSDGQIDFLRRYLARNHRIRSFDGSPTNSHSSSNSISNRNRDSNSGRAGDRLDKSRFLIGRSERDRLRVDPKQEEEEEEEVVEMVTEGSTVSGARNLRNKSNSKKKRMLKGADTLSNSIPFKISMSHELCNLDYQIVQQHLPCAFAVGRDIAGRQDGVGVYSLRNPANLTLPMNFTVKEVFMVREPVSRAVSVYYFWGELFKLVQMRKKSQLDSPNGIQFKVSTDKEPLKLGDATSKTPVLGQLFDYHGEESTVPPIEYAIGYAKRMAYQAGMPGPSYTWSAFADNLPDTLKILESDRIMAVVLERLDESLVVLSHYLDWSLADVLVAVKRKALSMHPKAKQWPSAAINVLRNKLEKNGEYAVYNSSIAKLDQRIVSLTNAGVDVQKEVKELQSLRKRVSKVKNMYFLKYKTIYSI